MRTLIVLIALLVVAAPAMGDVFTRLEVLRARVAVRIVADPGEPVVTRQLRVKDGLCTRDVTITTQGGRELARVFAPANCRRIAE